MMLQHIVTHAGFLLLVLHVLNILCALQSLMTQYPKESYRCIYWKLNNSAHKQPPLKANKAN